MKLDLAIEEFAALAKDYCEWVESPAGNPKSDIHAAISFLPRLYASALALPERFGEEEAREISHEQWKERFDRFTHLPLRNYSVCFNPLLVPSEEPAVGDIADDLSDIWRDIRPGLEQFENGLVDAAVWEWRYQFQLHWGHHASSAIYALHCWAAQEAQL